MERLEKFIKEHVPQVNIALEAALPKVDVVPYVLHEAMRYSVLGGGKRLRALMVLMCQGFGDSDESLMPAAVAMELIHAYSLVHDDLPAMDDDELRRGKLTTHKAYDEATAILVGDALLTLSFEVIAAGYRPTKVLKCTKTLARAAGHQGMIGGQVLDMEAENKKISAEDLEDIHRRKTGALISAACQIGAIVAGAENEVVEKLGAYGRYLGLAFQITDDILDVTADVNDLGKTIGKDERDGKATYVTVFGLEKAGELAKNAINEAKTALKDFGAEALMLRLLADYIGERKK